MNPTPPQPAFATFTAVVVLTAGAAACLAAAMLLTPGRAAIAGMTVTAVWTLALISLVPVALLGRRGVMPTAAAWFIGMFVRLVGCLGGYLLIALTTDLPTAPVFTALAVTYPTLTLIEAALVGRYLWQKDFLDRDRADTEAVGC